MLWFDLDSFSPLPFAPRVPQPPPLISSPSGCARGLNGWCHDYVWDDVPCRGSRGCPCCVCFFCSKHKLELRDWLMDPVLIPADMDGVLPGFYISEYDNLFCSFWTQNQIIGDFRMTLDNRDSRCCCTVFLSAKQRAAKCWAWNKDNDSSCVSPQWPCSIAWLAVMVFMALSVYTVQYFNVVPATECASGDWWWPKHAERRVKSKVRPLLSVSIQRWSEIKCFPSLLWRDHMMFFSLGGRYSRMSCFSTGRWGSWRWG